MKLKLNRFIKTYFICVLGNATPALSFAHTSRRYYADKIMMNKKNRFGKVLFLFLFDLIICMFNGDTMAQYMDGGYEHSVILCSNGKVYSCGKSASGQIGNGITGPNFTIPTQAINLSNVIAVAAGPYHSLALRDDGTVWAWGSNWEAELGIGSMSPPQSNTPVQALTPTNIIAIAGGAYAGFSVALRNDGTVWTWGSNIWGQLGDSTNITDSIPKQVPGLTNVIAITAGVGHVLTLRSDSTVWAWGKGNRGQLGNGVGTSTPYPVQVSNLTNVIAISAGSEHSLALKDDHTVWAWGKNWDGQLGDGTLTNKFTPVQTLGISNVISISAGFAYSLAVRSDGTAWGWGYNLQGRLIPGGPTYITTPVQLPTLYNIISIDASLYGHSFALRNDGTVWSWGDGPNGELGNGTISWEYPAVQMMLYCNLSDCQTNVVSGYVFNDLDSNCIHDSADQSLPWRLIKAEPGPIYALTDTSGYYWLCLDSGNYTLSLVDNYPFQGQVCPVAPSYYNINLNTADTLLTDINFGVQIIQTCPRLTVDISTWALRQCMPSSYKVNYCNYGTSEATNSSINITLDSNMSYIGTTGNFVSQNGNVLTFGTGSIYPNQCSSFYVYVDLACINSLLGSTICVKAHIFPDSSCNSSDSAWDKSSIVVQGQCEVDSLACFTISNTGDPVSGNMTGYSDYRIYENNTLVFTDSFLLTGGDSVLICWPANGRTIRLEADQRPGHPGKSHPQNHVEMCGGPPYFIGQIITVAEDDIDDYIEIDCQEVIASYDPNEKKVKPAGLTVNHYIDSTDVLEYQINFQNTGTDTAFRIVINDTLSQYLDITSVQTGASSHPYSFRIYGSGILEWTFNNILLPDSNTNEPASHGFVKFKVNQIAGNPTGTIIENRAGIVFDFNPNIVTNTTINIIGTTDSISPIALSNLEIDKLCDTLCDGTASVYVTGGALPYTYQWNDINSQTTYIATGLCAGSYNVTVTDALNYSDVAISMIPPPATPLYISYIINNLSCSGDSNGIVDLSISGGAPPYTYNWSTGDTIEDLSGIPAGNYYVEVLDFNNCQAMDSAIISGPLALSLVLSVSNPSCNGFCEGKASISTTGGIIPYNYIWYDILGDTIGSDSSITNLCPGKYFYIVSDANNCNITNQIVISQPPQIIISSIVDTATQSNNDGAIDITVSGGTLPYTYLWSTGANTEDIDSIPAGFYTVEITDSFGCVDSLTIDVPEVTGFDKLTVSHNWPIKVYPNLTEGKFTIEIFKPYEREKQFEINIHDILGRNITQIKTLSKQFGVDISKHPAGLYFIQLRSENDLYNARIVKQ